MKFKLLPISVIALIIVAPLSAQDTSAVADTIAPSQAIAYVGQVKTVCGRVASTNYAYRSRGRPTFLNLDIPYPEHIFTAVIWGANRSKFSPVPEVQYQGKHICVTGMISVYRSKAQIVVVNPSQIRIP